MLLLQERVEKRSVKVLSCPGHGSPKCRISTLEMVVKEKTSVSAAFFRCYTKPKDTDTIPFFCYSQWPLSFHYWQLFLGFLNRGGNVSMAGFSFNLVLMLYYFLHDALSTGGPVLI